MKHVIKLVVAVVVIGLIWLLTACNTVNGIGKDLQSASYKYVEQEN